MCFSGEALKVSAERFADDPCFLPKREAVVQVARALLTAVTRLLILADMIDVMHLLQHVSAVSKRWLRMPPRGSHFQFCSLHLAPVLVLLDLVLLLIVLVKSLLG